VALVSKHSLDGPETGFLSEGDEDLPMVKSSSPKFSLSTDEGKFTMERVRGPERRSGHGEEPKDALASANSNWSQSHLSTLAWWRRRARLTWFTKVAWGVHGSIWEFWGMIVFDVFRSVYKQKAEN
jgi:hypothetical protein